MALGLDALEAGFVCLCACLREKERETWLESNQRHKIVAGKLSEVKGGCVILTISPFECRLV